MRRSVLLHCDQTNQTQKHTCTWLPDHCDDPNRLKSVREIWAEKEKDLLNRCHLTRGRHASTAEVRLCHSFDHLHLLANTNAISSQWALETLSGRFERVFLSGGSYEAAMWAAGSAIDIVERLLPHSNLMSQRFDGALALVRPAGHEALYDQPRYHCLLNNVALAAKVAAQRHNLQRILIIDWGKTPGIGTMQLLAGDARFCFVSVFSHLCGTQWPWLTDEDIKSYESSNATLIPLNTNAIGDREFLAIFLHIIIPIAREFQPQLILISAGLDGLQSDPLSNWTLSSLIYAHLVRLLQINLRAVPVCLILENSYISADPSCQFVIAEALEWIVRCLLGDRLPHLFPTDSSNLNPSLIRSIRTTIAWNRAKWRCLEARFEMLSRGTKPRQWSEDSYGDYWQAAADEETIEQLCISRETVLNWRCKRDQLLDRAMYPTRRDRKLCQIYPDKDYSIHSDSVNYSQKTTTPKMMQSDKELCKMLKPPPFLVTVCFPAKCSHVELIRLQFSTAENSDAVKKVLFIEQNRPVSDRELDLLTAQTDPTTNHLHDFGGSQLVIDRENGACRITGALLAAIDTVGASLAHSAVCIVDVAQTDLTAAVTSAVPIIRKMGKIGNNHRLLVVDFSDEFNHSEDFTSDSFRLISMKKCSNNNYNKSKNANGMDYLLFNQLLVPEFYEYSPQMVFLIGQDKDDLFRSSVTYFTLLACAKVIAIFSTECADIFIHGVISSLVLPRSAVRSVQDSTNLISADAVQQQLCFSFGDSTRNNNNNNNNFLSPDGLFYSEEFHSNATEIRQQIGRNEQFSRFTGLETLNHPNRSSAIVGPKHARSPLVTKFLHKLLFCVPTNCAAVHLKKEINK